MMRERQAFLLTPINCVLIVAMLGLGFSGCATNNAQFDYSVAHIDDVIAAKGEASEVYYDEELGHVYVWESGIGDSPTRVHFYANGDGTVTGWSVSSQIFRVRF